MAHLGADERYWLESNWSMTSKSVLNIVIPFCGEVIEAIIVNGTPEPHIWSRFVDRACRALDKVRTALATSERSPRTGGAPPRSVMYATAISLFGDSEPMLEELIRAKPRLVGTDAGGVAWACLRSGLYRMRLRASWDVENRAKTWRRLQPIVARICEESGWHLTGPQTETRYSDALCDRVAAYVREHHPTDHNLPRERDLVKAFFAQFCEDYFEPEEASDVDAESVEMLPDLRRGLVYLQECKSQLESPLAEVYETSLHRGDTSVSAFCLKAGMDRRKFHHIRVKAEAILSECVTGKLRARMIAAAS